MTRRRTDRRHALEPIGLLLIGAWIAITLTLWTALANHRAALAPHAAASEPERHLLEDRRMRLDRALQLRLNLAELVLAVALVLITVWRREHGVRLFLPFLLLTVTIALAVYLHPELAANAEGRLTTRWLPRGTTVLEFTKVTGLFVLFVLGSTPPRGRA